MLLRKKQMPARGSLVEGGGDIAGDDGVACGDGIVAASRRAPQGEPGDVLKSDTCSDFSHKVESASPRSDCKLERFL